MASSRAQPTTFAWQGRDRQGKPLSGTLHAHNAQTAKAQLRAHGVYDLKLKRHRALSISTRGRIRSKDLSLLTRQLATMVQAGIAIVRAFEIAARSARTPKMRAVIDQIQRSVEQGTPLHRAFAEFPQHFDALYCATIASGEASGSLDEVLEGLAHHLEKAEHLRAKVRSALMYPSVVSLVTVAAVSVIMVYMVPAFEAQFASFGAPLPAITQVVIAMSRALSSYGIGLLLALGILVWLLVRIWRRGLIGRQRMDQLALRLPILGRLLRKAAVARWARTLSTLAHAGVPLLEALPVVGHAAGNGVYRHASEHMATAINDGNSLSRAMHDTAVFPETIVHMCALGEESGALDAMLSKSASMLENEVDEAVSGLSSILEPIMIIVLGVVIGGILLAMYMPIFQLGRVI